FVAVMMSTNSTWQYDESLRACKRAGNAGERKCLFTLGGRRSCDAAQQVGPFLVIETRPEPRRPVKKAMARNGGRPDCVDLRASGFEMRVAIRRFENMRSQTEFGNEESFWKLAEWNEETGVVRGG